MYFGFDIENSEKDPKFELCDHVKISRCKIIFAKVYIPIWSKEVFVIKKVKNNLSWARVI